MPILCAVPSITFSAASMVVALRSGNFVWAISRICWRVMVPTLSRLGTADPLGTPAAFLRRSAAGGVLSTNVNERSSKTVISTGMTVPACAAVRSLYSLTNCMTLIWGATAGPTGGAGVALPASICSLMTVFTFFAICFSLELLDLKEVQLNRRLAPEEAHQNLDFVALGADFVHHTDELGERTVDDAHVLAP